jgi:hypothetical protein
VASSSAVTEDAKRPEGRFAELAWDQAAPDARSVASSRHRSMRNSSQRNAGWGNWPQLHHKYDYDVVDHRLQQRCSTPVGDVDASTAAVIR